LARPPGPDALKEALSHGDDSGAGTAGQRLRTVEVKASTPIPDVRRLRLG